jgi:ribose transport system permease protein
VRRLLGAPGTRKGFLSEDRAAAPALVFMLLLIVVGATTNPAFVGPINIGNVLIQITPLMLIALGQMLVIGTGGLDLSVGSVASLSAVIGAQLFAPLGAPLAVTAALVVGGLIGLVNGAAVAWGLEPFLVTLATFSIAQGLALLISPVPGGDVPDWFVSLAQTWNSIPLALPAVLLIAILVNLLLRRTSLGSNLLSVGGNRQIASDAGLRVSSTLIRTYLVTSLLAAAGGLFLVARTGTGDPLIGARYALDSLAAVVVGGTLLAGGRATVLGTVIGVIALGLIPNVLNLAQVPTFYQTAVKGAVLLLAITIPLAVSRYLQRRRALRTVESRSDGHLGAATALG